MDAIKEVEVTVTLTLNGEEAAFLKKITADLLDKERGNAATKSFLSQLYLAIHNVHGEHSKQPTGL